MRSNCNKYSNMGVAVRNAKRSIAVGIALMTMWVSSTTALGQGFKNEVCTSRQLAEECKKGKQQGYELTDPGCKAYCSECGGEDTVADKIIEETEKKGISALTKFMDWKMKNGKKWFGSCVKDYEIIEKFWDLGVAAKAPNACKTDVQAKGVELSAKMICQLANCLENAGLVVTQEFKWACDLGEKFAKAVKCYDYNMYGLQGAKNACKASIIAARPAKAEACDETNKWRVSPVDNCRNGKVRPARDIQLECIEVNTRMLKEKWGGIPAEQRGSCLQECEIKTRKLQLGCKPGGETASTWKPPVFNMGPHVPHPGITVTKVCNVEAFPYFAPCSGGMNEESLYRGKGKRLTAEAVKKECRDRIRFAGTVSGTDVVRVPEAMHDDCLKKCEAAHYKAWGNAICEESTTTTKATIPTKPLIQPTTTVPTRNPSICVKNSGWKVIDGCEADMVGHKWAKLDSTISRECDEMVDYRLGAACKGYPCEIPAAQGVSCKTLCRSEAKAKRDQGCVSVIATTVTPTTRTSGSSSTVRPTGAPTTRAVVTTSATVRPITTTTWRPITTTTWRPATSTVTRPASTTTVTTTTTQYPGITCSQYPNDPRCRRP
jgi:hypothetical protein